VDGRRCPADTQGRADRVVQVSRAGVRRAGGEKDREVITSCPPDLLSALHRSIPAPSHPTWVVGAVTAIQWDDLPPAHEQALARVTRLLEEDPDVDAALLQGSLARGDAHLHADLELLVLVPDEVASSDVRDSIGGVRVEQHRTSLRHLRERLAERPGLAYGIVESRTLVDRANVVDALRDEARSVLATFRVRSARRHELARWLESGVERANSALASSDARRASFVVATASWPLVEALWAANARPVPPAGAVLARMASLPCLPAEFAVTLDRLLLGDVAERVAAFITLATWVVEELRES
jgi:hypothetical protein